MNKFYLSLILLSILAVSCKEFIEPSISKRTVKLLAPANNTESSIYNQTFWWDSVDDALSYRFQLVTPSFDQAASLVMDTVVKDTKFIFVLEPGTYQWRVRAENGSSQTAYTTASFSVYSSAISNQQVLLKSPANNLLTNVTNLSYQWEKLYGATRYHLQIDTNNFADEEKLFFDDTTPGQALQVSFKTERTYQWRVRAESDTAQSKWSPVYRVSFDKTPPAAVSLAAPETNTMVPRPVKLQWSAAEGAKTYELLVLKSDSSTLYNGTFPLTLSETSYNFNAGDPGEKIYWKVRAIDAIGNKGVYSEVRNFSIQ